MDAIPIILAFGPLYAILVSTFILPPHLVPPLVPLHLLLPPVSLLSHKGAAASAAIGAFLPFASSESSSFPPPFLSNNTRRLSSATYKRLSSSFTILKQNTNKYRLIVIGDLLVGKPYRFLQWRVSRAFITLSPLTFLLCRRFE
jgi:hypothetical protein